MAQRAEFSGKVRKGLAGRAVAADEFIHCRKII
jgi:hypothetical protein